MVTTCFFLVVKATQGKEIKIMVRWSVGKSVKYI